MSNMCASTHMHRYTYQEYGENNIDDLRGKQRSVFRKLQLL